MGLRYDQVMPSASTVDAMETASQYMLCGADPKGVCKVLLQAFGRQGDALDMHGPSHDQPCNARVASAIVTHQFRMQ